MDDEIEFTDEELAEDNAYAEQRAVSYPSVKEQLDDIFHNGLEGWKASVQAVKDKYPKG
jgi:hypothetical protein